MGIGASASSSSSVSTTRRGTASGAAAAAAPPIVRRGSHHAKKTTSSPDMANNNQQAPSSHKSIANNLIDKEAIERSQRIDRELAKAKTEELKTIKLLLLGGAESGKSTFVKQMKILHLNGFSESELINYRYLIYANVALAMSQLLRAVEELKIVPNGISSEDVESFKAIADELSVCNHDLTPELGSQMERLWTCNAVQEAYARRREFELLDSAKYFLDDLQRISIKNYKPNMQDILRSRAATMGIYEISFHYKEYFFRMVDVGGQKTERRKWIHCFDNVTAIMFVTSLAEYDQTLAEEKQLNRMHDSLSLFKSIASNSYFVKTSILLFLNKKDVFAEKIPRSPLTVCFPDYRGANTYEEASEYILKEFVRRKPSDKSLYSHFTMATDTKNVEVVFAASMDTILKKTLSNVGVY